jgi:hypothetical protein
MKTKPSLCEYAPSDYAHFLGQLVESYSCGFGRITEIYCNNAIVVKFGEFETRVYSIEMQKKLKFFLKDF